MAWTYFWTFLPKNSPHQHHLWLNMRGSPYFFIIGDSYGNLISTFQVPSARLRVLKGEKTFFPCQESNLGLLISSQASYHWTTEAVDPVCICIPEIYRASKVTLDTAISEWPRRCRFDEPHCCWALGESP